MRRTICILGLGGVGSSILCRILSTFIDEVEEIHIIDKDTVEVSNTPHQEYLEEDIGKHKVDATEEKIRRTGYKGRIHKYIMDINHPEEHLVKDLLGCDVYISAVDTYQSRVNFFYYIVMESTNQERIHIDCGAEGNLAHCFINRKDSACIYCIRMLFPSGKVSNICSVGAAEEKITQEKIPSTVLGIYNGLEEDGLPKEAIYRRVTEIFNQKYSGDHKISEKEVEYIITNILPNTPSINTIISSILLLVLYKKIDQSKNFLIYSGKKTPILHQYSLKKDKKCILCPKKEI